MNVQGTCDARFAMVQQVVEANLANGQDVGCSVAVIHDGEFVVDLWGGYRDAERTLPWTSDTVVCVFSTTKTMVSLCALTLASRGELDLDAPIVRYWPEFGAHGKDRVLVRHALAHTAGIPTWTSDLDVEDLYDWDRATSLLAASELLWEPGTVHGYHAITFGYLLGEVVRRITGVSVGTFLRDAVAGPMDAAFSIGIPPDVDPLVAEVVPPRELVGDLVSPGTLGFRVQTNPPVQPHDTTSTDWRRAEIPAANGYGNARSVATLQAAVSCGAAGLVSDAVRARIFEEQARGEDRVTGAPLVYGIGYALSSDLLTVSPNSRACFWGGSGGSIVVNDLDERLTVAYAMNRQASGSEEFDRCGAIVFATYASLAISA